MSTSGLIDTVFLLILFNKHNKAQQGFFFYEPLIMFICKLFGKGTEWTRRLACVWKKAVLQFLIPTKHTGPLTAKREGNCGCTLLLLFNMTA